MKLALVTASATRRCGTDDRDLLCGAARGRAGWGSPDGAGRGGIRLGVLMRGAAVIAVNGQRRVTWTSPCGVSSR